MPDLSTRIKAIQKQLAVSQTGTIDLPTCQKLEVRLNISVNSASLITHIKKIQAALKILADGLIGPVTISRVEALIVPKLPDIPAGASMVVSQKSLDAIVAYEVSSKQAYNKYYQSPTWPGGESGVTIGIGFDIGYCTKQELTKAWKDTLPASSLNALLAICGKKGAQCKAMLPGLKNIKVPYDAAIKVFYHTTLPACAADVRKVYPGVEKLPPDAQGALLSLVYNRGPVANDTDRRKEMKAIIPLAAIGDLNGIAAQLRSMKRLWPKPEQKGLVARREAEAKMVENATMDILPEEIVIV